MGVNQADELGSDGGSGFIFSIFFLITLVACMASFVLKRPSRLRLRDVRTPLQHKGSRWGKSRATSQRWFGVMNPSFTDSIFLLTQKRCELLH